MKIVYEGKAKYLAEGPKPGTLLMVFKDTVTAGDGAKRAELPGKGSLCKGISSVLFLHLHEHGIPTHYLGETEEGLLVRQVRIIPLEVVVRNLATGSIVRRLGLEKGKPFSPPLFELFYKNDALHDPFICEDHAVMLGLATKEEIARLRELALKANQVLYDFFAGRGFTLVDIKFEFGYDPDGNLVLADEISPDTFRLWKTGTQESYDKDVFREDKGDLIAAYRAVAQAIGALSH